MNFYFRHLLAIYILLFSSSMFAMNCGVTFPKSELFSVKEREGCDYEISNHENYAHLNAIAVYRRPVIQVLDEESLIYIDNGKRYFIFEEVVGDPRFTQHTIRNDEIKPGISGSAKFYGADWIGFVQNLPGYGDDSPFYSLKIKCTSMVFGKKRYALLARFCAPATREGEAKIESFKAFVSKIRISK